MYRDIGFSVLLGILSTAFLSFSVAGADGSPSSVLPTFALMTLSTLPLFLAGLGIGLAGAAIAVLTGAIIAAAFISGLFGVTYVVTCGIPVLILVRQALLWREEDEVIVWYPASGLMVFWTAICFALSGISILWFDLNDDIRQELIRQFQPMVAEVKKQSAIYANITAEDIVWLMPQFFGPSWGLILLLSGCLAQGLLARFNKSLRPSPEFSGFAMPKWVAVIAVIAILASIAFNLTTPYLGAAVLVLELVFFLQGMAVIHRVSMNWNYRSLVLWAVYLILILFMWPVLIISLLGLADSWIGFRSRRKAAPDQEED